MTKCSRCQRRRYAWQTDQRVNEQTKDQGPSEEAKAEFIRHMERMMGRPLTRQEINMAILQAGANRAPVAIFWAVDDFSLLSLFSFCPYQAYGLPAFRNCENHRECFPLMVVFLRVGLGPVAGTVLNLHP